MLSEIKLRLNLAPCGACDTKKGLFETTDNFSISAVELLQRPDQAEHAPPPPPAPAPICNDAWRSTNILLFKPYKSHGSYAHTLTKICLTPRRPASQGQRSGDNEEFFAGGHSKL